MRSGEPCSAPADRRKSCVDSMPSCPSNLMVLPRLSPETIPSPHVSDRGSLPEQISTRPTVVSPPTYGDDSSSALEPLPGPAGSADGPAGAGDGEVRGRFYHPVSQRSRSSGSVGRGAAMDRHGGLEAASGQDADRGRHAARRL